MRKHGNGKGETRIFWSLALALVALSVAVSAVVVRMFGKAMDDILQRIIGDDVRSGWSTYMRFAVYVVGISGGVRIWELERFIGPVPEGVRAPELTAERFVLELYRSAIGSLQSVAWVLLFFFLVTLIAFVIVRFLESRASKP